MQRCAAGDGDGDSGSDQGGLRGSAPSAVAQPFGSGQPEDGSEKRPRLQPRARGDGAGIEQVGIGRSLLALSGHVVPAVSDCGVQTSSKHAAVRGLPCLLFSLVAF